jgi:hypothetical protein
MMVTFITTAVRTLNPLETDRWIGRETDGKETQTDRQAGRQTYRQTERQTNRQRKSQV